MHLQGKGSVSGPVRPNDRQELLGPYYQEYYHQIVLRVGERLTEGDDISLEERPVVFILSDSLGETVELVVRAALQSQFEVLHRL